MSKKKQIVPSEAWRQIAYSSVHIGIHSNERLLLGFGSATIGALIAFVSFVAFTGEFRDGVLPGLVLITVPLITASIALLILYRLARRITCAFARIVRFEENAGFYLKTKKGPLYPERLKKAANKLPITYHALFAALLVIVLASAVLGGLHLGRHSTLPEELLGHHFPPPVTNNGGAPLDVEVTNAYNINGVAGNKHHPPYHGYDHQPFTNFFAQCIPGPITSVVKGGEATDVLIQFTCKPTESISNSPD